MYAEDYTCPDIRILVVLCVHVVYVHDNVHDSSS